MVVEMKVIETSRDKACAYCEREDISMPNPLQLNGKGNSFWVIETQQRVGIIYGYKGNGRVLILDLMSKYPKEIFLDDIRDWIYRLKQSGIVVESQIEGLKLEKDSMLLPTSIDEVLKVVSGQSIR